jgi:alkane 1-monooxygenase
MKKLKYLSVFLLPLTVHISFTSTGLLTFLPVIFFFGVVPMCELILKPNSNNLKAQERRMVEKDWFFDGLIFLVVPLQIFFLIYFLDAISLPDLPVADMIGRITSMGLMCGVLGINLGHELGHRSKRLEQFLGEVLLLTSLENHFLPYHNYGHHKYVATPYDPATARRGESVYFFWVRSHFGSYAVCLATGVESVEKKAQNSAFRQQ